MSPITLCDIPGVTVLPAEPQHGHGPGGCHLVLAGHPVGDVPHEVRDSHLPCQVGGGVDMALG